MALSDAGCPSQRTERARAAYVEIPAVEVEVVPGTSPAPCVRRTGAALALAVWASAAAAVLWHRAPLPGFLWGTLGQVESKAAGPQVHLARTCTEYPGLRLPSGREAARNSGKAAPDAKACKERCLDAADCAQAVFTTAEGGQCFLFQEAASLGTAAGAPEQVQGAAEAAPVLYSSAICGSPAAVAARDVAVKRMERAELQKAWHDAETRAKETLATVPLQDKFTLLQGTSSQSGYAGFLNPGNIPGAKPLRMNDGPQGFNVYTDAGLAGTSTQFPALLTVAASFDPEVSRRYAAAIAEEFLGKGSNVLLGPDLEVIRVPSTGRSFETLSGEDPYLGSQLVPPFVKEVQSKGIIATIKHWLDNNQEIRRMTMNVEVGDRAQHEIYMPPFKAAIDAGAAAVMCSYNKVYGTHACENEKLLKQLLREDAGFKGMIMSDWGATHDATNSANHGLDVEMPGDGEFTRLPTFVGQGTVDAQTIDTMATHVLASMYAVGQFDGRFTGGNEYSVSHADVTTDAHRDVARQTIVDGAVLLKNQDAVLPIATAGKKIAMVGKYCNEATYMAPSGVTASLGTPFMGQGSGYVPTYRTVTPLKGLQDRVTDAAEITFSADATAAKDADVAIVCASECDVHEGWDRMNFSVPEARQLVNAIKAFGSTAKIVVVAIAPGAVTTGWLSEADAALLLLMPGEQVGVALAQLLVGDHSPGGRLPVTLLPDGWKPIGGYPAGSDHLFLSEQYPGIQPAPEPTYEWGDYLTANFTEGVLVGYRWFDAMKVEPKVPFGFGLTYTDFAFTDFEATCTDSDIVLSFKVANSGKRAGAAVPQIYVSFPSLLPVERQLKGFKKVWLEEGAEAVVAHAITQEDISFYDEKLGRWVSAVERNEQVTVSVGTSSRDLVWTKVVSCKAHLEKDRSVVMAG